MDKQTKEFVYHKNGWGNPNAKKPKNGRLTAIKGNQTRVIMEDKPFGLLNWKKNQMRKDAVWNGWELKITY